MRQCLRQALAFGAQLAQRIAHQAELIHRRLEFVAVTAGQGRPGFGGRGNALACLCQQGRVEQAKAWPFVVHRRVALQTKALAHGLQCRRGDRGRRLGRRLRTEKQQILQQTLSDAVLALGQRGVLHEHARCDALGVQIGLERLLRQGLEEAGADRPEHAHLGLCLCRGKTLGDGPHVCGRIRVGVLDDAQHGAVQARARLGAIGQRGHAHGQGRGLHGRVHGPQIGRMHAIDASQGLHVAVLRKQGDR